MYHVRAQDVDERAINVHYYYYYYYYDLGDVHFFCRTVKRCTSGGVHVPSVYPHAR